MTLTSTDTGLEVICFNQRNSDAIIITRMDPAQKLGERVLDLTYEEFFSGVSEALFNPTEARGKETPRGKIISALAQTNEIEGYNVGQRRLEIPDYWDNRIDSREEVPVFGKKLPLGFLLDTVAYVVENTDLRDSKDPRLKLIEEAKEFEKRSN